jgi:hypothetical protein
VPTLIKDIQPTSGLSTRVSVEFNQNEERFKASALAPVVVEELMEGRFPTAPVNQMLRRKGAELPAYGQLKTSSLKFGEATFRKIWRGHGIEIDDRVPPPLDYWDIPGTAINAARAVPLLEHEFHAVDVLAATGNYLSTHRLTLGTDTQFDDPDSDPIGVFQTVLDALSLAANGVRQIAGGIAFWNALARHEDITKQVQYVSGSALNQMTIDKVAAMLNFERAVNLDATWDASIPTPANPETPDIRRVWGKDVICQVIDPNPGRGTSGHAITISSRDPLVESDAFETPPYITTYYAALEAVIIITNPYAGFLIKAAVA